MDITLEKLQQSKDNLREVLSNQFKVEIGEIIITRKTDYRKNNYFDFSCFVTSKQSLFDNVFSRYWFQFNFHFESDLFNFALNVKWNYLNSGENGADTYKYIKYIPESNSWEILNF